MGSVAHPGTILNVKARDSVSKGFIFVIHFPSLLINNPNPDTGIRDRVAFLGPWQASKK